MDKVIYNNEEWELINRKAGTCMLKKNGAYERVSEDSIISYEKHEALLELTKKIRLEIEVFQSTEETQKVVEEMFGDKTLAELGPEDLAEVQHIIRIRKKGEIYHQEKKRIAIEKEAERRTRSEKECYCISIQQPWADAIIHGCEIQNEAAAREFDRSIGEKVFKNIENRYWPLEEKYKNIRVYIHTGKKYHTGGEEWLRTHGLKPTSRSEAVLGAIVGSLVFSSDISRGSIVWAMEGQYHWEICGAMPLKKPIPYKGQPKFFAINRKELGLPDYDQEGIDFRETNRPYSIGRPCSTSPTLMPRVPRALPTRRQRPLHVSKARQALLSEAHKLSREIDNISIVNAAIATAYGTVVPIEKLGDVCLECLVDELRNTAF